MSADFQTVLVTDSTIHDITPDLEYGVKSGASSTTYQSFPASSPAAAIRNRDAIVPLQVHAARTRSPGFGNAGG